MYVLGISLDDVKTDLSTRTISFTVNMGYSDSSFGSVPKHDVSTPAGKPVLQPVKGTIIIRSVIHAGTKWLITCIFDHWNE